MMVKTFEDSQDFFREGFPTGFPWEVVKVFRPVRWSSHGDTRLTSRGNMRGMFCVPYLFCVPYRFAFLITSTNPQFPWSRAPPRASQDDFWHSMGNDWETSNTIRQTNPYLNWYYQQQIQMDLFAPATHVGKINRGSFSNPEANMPRHQAYGINHDFNPEDLQQGAFKRKPKGQNLVANQVHFVLY